MFRGRLMWPIRDLTGETIAFGARKLNPDDDPKYLNTPETQIFKKSHVLYGADLAKREIAKRRQAVIVEGYTDVMACHLSGVPTAVATSGTSFGEDHVKVLRQADHGHRRVRRRGDLHVRRRRGRPEGGAARVQPRGEVRHADLRRRAAGRPRPVRPAAEARRGRRPRPGGPAGAAVRVRDQGGARQARPGHARGAVRRDRRGRADHRADQGPGEVEAVRRRPRPVDRVQRRAVHPGPGPARRRGHEGDAGVPPLVRQRRRGTRRRTASGAPTRARDGRPGSGRTALRPLRPGAAGGAGGAQARGAVAGADRARVRHARRGGVQRAGPRRRVRADRRPAAGWGPRGGRGTGRRRCSRRRRTTGRGRS